MQGNQPPKRRKFQQRLKVQWPAYTMRLGQILNANPANPKPDLLAYFLAYLLGCLLAY